VKKRRIAVFGGSQCTDDVLKTSFEVGRLLAKKDVIIYCGGRSGVMKSVSQGVSEAGGTVVGILPDNSCDSSNKYITIPVATGVGQGRNIIIANSVEGAIAINGAYGTLSEIAHTLSQGKPVVGLGTWDIKGVIQVITPKEAVETVLGLI